MMIVDTQASDELYLRAGVDIEEMYSNVNSYARKNDPEVNLAFQEIMA